MVKKVQIYTSLPVTVVLEKINEIIDHLNILEAQNGKQHEVHVLTALGTIGRAKADVNNLISQYGIEDKAKFYAKDIRGHGRRVTCVIKVNDWSPYAVGRARCSPSDNFYFYIGQIIALRRALGLEVPHYYTHMTKKEG